MARCDNATMAKVYLGELAALVSLIAARARLMRAQGICVPEDDSAVKRAVVKAADFQSLHELAFAVTNSLKNKFTCDQVVLGQVESGHIRVLSISGLDNVYPKKNFKKFNNPANIELYNGDFRIIVPNLFLKEPNLKVDIYYYDGGHSYENQWKGLDIIQPYLADKCIIFVDDTNWDVVKRVSADSHWGSDRAGTCTVGIGAPGRQALRSLHETHQDEPTAQPPRLE